MTNVTVDHIFSTRTRVRFLLDGQGYPGGELGTVTITDTVVKDDQKSGFEPRGSTIMNLSDSTAGPSHPLEGLISQNGVSYVGARRQPWRKHDLRSGNAQPGVGGNGAGTAVLLSGAHDVTVTNNTLTSPAGRPGTDIGISVSAGSGTGNVISWNTVNRRGPDVPDTSGIGIDVSPGWLECDVDLQHLQPVDYQRYRCGTDCLHPAAQRLHEPGLLGPRSGCRQRQELHADLSSSMPRRSRGRLSRGRSRRGCRCRREGRSPEPPPQRGLTTSL